jgi:hypothetical protein
VRSALTFAASLLLVVCGCASTPQTDTPRIDGTSDQSFDQSYVKLVQKLSSQEQRRFALALFSVLLPEKCLSSDAVVALTFLPASADRKAQLRTCRTQLNGKSYQDIVGAAEAKKTAADVSRRRLTIVGGVRDA